MLLCLEVCKLNDFVYLLLYVDDMLIVGTSMEVINSVKGKLSQKFEMKDLGESTPILGIRIFRDNSIGMLKLSREDYILK